MGSFHGMRLLTQTKPTHTIHVWYIYLYESMPYMDAMGNKSVWPQKFFCFHHSYLLEGYEGNHFDKYFSDGLLFQPRTKKNEFVSFEEWND